MQEYLLYLMKPVAEGKDEIITYVYTVLHWIDPADMKRAAANADEIRRQLHEDKKELYAGESESDSSSDSEFSSDENEDTSDSISSQMTNHN